MLFQYTDCTNPDPNLWCVLRAGVGQAKGNSQKVRVLLGKKLRVVVQRICLPPPRQPRGILSRPARLGVDVLMAERQTAQLSPNFFHNNKTNLILVAWITHTSSLRAVLVGVVGGHANASAEGVAAVGGNVDG